jgi:hypothetical protein
VEAMAQEPCGVEGSTCQCVVGFAGGSEGHWRPAPQHQRSQEHSRLSLILYSEFTQIHKRKSPRAGEPQLGGSG